MHNQTLDEMIEILREKLQVMFSHDKTGHNIDHLQRTMNNAIMLQKVEGGNLNVIAISAFIHDIHRIMTDDKKTLFRQKTVCQK